MKVTFDSVAVFDEKSRAVRFAGRYLGQRKTERFMICRVSPEALAKLCNVPEPTPEAMIEAYASNRDSINDIAIRKLIAGEHRPVIGLDDLLTLPD